MEKPNSDLPEAPSKWRCENCLEVIAEPRSAPHPFIKGEDIYGCTECGETDLRQVCQVGTCEQLASGGYPRGHGFRYVWTCYEHRP